jgi:curved DNA-binding protein CbpA
MSTGINPYEFLGVTYRSTYKEVKAAYNNLSLILHPDKGGNNNEMMVLTNAYEYIIKQIKWAGSSSSDQALSDSNAVKNLEQSFVDFCKEQEDEQEKNNVVTSHEHFNRMWETSQNPVWKSAYEGGYSVERKQTLPNPACDYDPSSAFDQPIEPFTSQLVIYEEPEPFLKGPESNIDYKTFCADLNDYSDPNGLSDYKQAYTMNPLQDSRTIIEALPSDLKYINTIY